MKINIPTMLTWLRILLIPVFVGAFYWPENLRQLSTMPSHMVNVFATTVFAIAAFTDWLDGYLARRWHQTSAFGAFLDPVADKLMVAAALIVLDLCQVRAGAVHPARSDPTRHRQRTLAAAGPRATVSGRGRAPRARGRLRPPGRAGIREL